ncbi:IclR family transcriptional regulator [Brevibacterium sanguinis]|uniref:IclR family transcriptional regulator n=2 Tax=Brevibacterium TaxID=1696 RepID=A0A366IL52_9MICO|nr:MULTISPECIES: IclR family transcriptional regulator [Brevibacterium]RBP65684.1 IclR family transcriptional regulator [Brevibacterium sanguinis]RBP72318.1 IclR family transcriptional regulator [Brevibacterium celere]
MPPKGSNTVTKAFAMLELLGEHPEGISAAAAAEATGHPFSTAYRLLGGLVESGYAEYDPTSRLYTLGLEVFRLSQKVAHRRGFDGATKDLLKALTRETGESSLLSVRQGNASLTVLTVDGPQYRTTTDPGDHAPLHTSALGQVLLAFDPDHDRVVDELDLVPRTPNSITDPARLRTRIAEIRDHGFAAQSEENDIGMNALAVPVLDLDGRLLAALALAAPVFRRSLDDLIELVPRLTETAARVAARLPR